MLIANYFCLVTGLPWSTTVLVSILSANDGYIVVYGDFPRLLNHVTMPRIAKDFEWALPIHLRVLSSSLVPRPLPLRGRGSGDIRAISWANKIAARRNVNAPIRLQNSGDVT